MCQINFIKNSYTQKQVDKLLKVQWKTLNRGIKKPKHKNAFSKPLKMTKSSKIYEKMIDIE